MVHAHRTCIELTSHTRYTYITHALHAHCPRVARTSHNPMELGTKIFGQFRQHIESEKSCEKNLTLSLMTNNFFPRTYTVYYTVLRHLQSVEPRPARVVALLHFCNCGNYRSRRGSRNLGCACLRKPSQALRGAEANDEHIASWKKLRCAHACVRYTHATHIMEESCMSDLLTIQITPWVQETFRRFLPPKQCAVSVATMRIIPRVR